MCTNHPSLKLSNYTFEFWLSFKSIFKEVPNMLGNPEYDYLI